MFDWYLKIRYQISLFRMKIYIFLDFFEGNLAKLFEFL